MCQALWRTDQLPASQRSMSSELADRAVFCGESESEAGLPGRLNPTITSPELSTAEGEAGLPKLGRTECTTNASDFSQTRTHSRTRERQVRSQSSATARHHDSTLCCRLMPSPPSPAKKNPPPKTAPPKKLGREEMTRLQRCLVPRRVHLASEPAAAKESLSGVWQA